MINMTDITCIIRIIFYDDVHVYFRRCRCVVWTSKMEKYFFIPLFFSLLLVWWWWNAAEMMMLIV